MTLFEEAVLESLARIAEALDRMAPMQDTQPIPPLQTERRGDALEEPAMRMAQALGTTAAEAVMAVTAAWNALAVQPPPAPEPDALAHLVPPLAEWPADAVAAVIDANGYVMWLGPFEDRWWVAYSGQGPDRAPIKVAHPPGYDWRASLHLRPQGA